MKALSIRQPFAWLIIQGIKDIEIRSRNTNIRGKFLIHASKYRPSDKELSDIGAELKRCGVRKANLPLSNEEYQYGGIIGSAELVDVLTHESDYDSIWFYNESGVFGYVLENAKAMPFKPFKGKVGWFNVN